MKKITLLVLLLWCWNRELFGQIGLGIGGAFVQPTADFRELVAPGVGWAGSATYQHRAWLFSLDAFGSKHRVLEKSFSISQGTLSTRISSDDDYWDYWGIGLGAQIFMRETGKIRPFGGLTAGLRFNGGHYIFEQTSRFGTFTGTSSWSNEGSTHLFTGAKMGIWVDLHPNIMLVSDAAFLINRPWDQEFYNRFPEIPKRGEDPSIIFSVKILCQFPAEDWGYALRTLWNFRIL